MNIEQLNQNTTKIQSVVKNEDNGNHIVNFASGKSIQTECENPRDALFSVVTKKNEVFQMCDVSDLGIPVPEDQYHTKEFLISFNEYGSFVSLYKESNGSYSFGTVSSYIVTFFSKESHPFEDDKHCYISNCSQNFRQTNDGLQEAINCFFDRMKSPNPHKTSEKWTGMSLQDIKSTLK